MTARVRITHRWVLACWSLLLLLVFGQQMRQGWTLSQLGWALVFAMPLLICAKGLWQAQRQTFRWATLCVLPYFVVGVTESVANELLRPWALLLLGGSLLWFFALIAHLRVSGPQANH